MVIDITNIFEAKKIFKKATNEEAISFAKMLRNHKVCGYAYNVPEELPFSKEFTNVYDADLADYIVVFSSSTMDGQLVVHFQTEIYDIPYELEMKWFDELEDFIINTIRDASIKDYPDLVPFLDSDIYISSMQ